MCKNRFQVNSSIFSSFVCVFVHVHCLKGQFWWLYCCYTRFMFPVQLYNCRTNIFGQDQTLVREPANSLTGFLMLHFFFVVSYS